MHLPDLPLLGHIKKLRAQGKAPGLLETLATPGVHERAMTEVFGPEAMRFTGEAPVFDQPLVLVAFTNRCGSNLACDYLRQTGKIGGGGEHLNHPYFADRQATKPVTSLPDYIRSLHKDLVVPGRSLALKASWDQLAMLLRGNILAMYPRVILLHCRRNDALAQAVSYGIALRSGSWISRQKGEEVSSKEVPAEEIERQIETFHRANLLIQLLCDAHGLTHWDIGYELLCVDQGRHLARVLQREKLVAPGWMPGQPAIERQAGPLNAELAQDFLASVRQATGH